MRHGGLESGARGAVAHLRCGAGSSVSARARQHRSRGGAACRGRAAIWPRPSSSSRASRERPRSPTASSAISGSAPAETARSSSRSPIPAHHSRSWLGSAASAAPFSIRPTSAVATRPFRYFGLVPAALIGVDLEVLLHRAHRMAEACAACVPALQNPAAWLGAILGEGALAGRDKLTFVLSPGIASFGPGPSS